MTNKEVINFLDQVRKIILDDKSWLESTIQPINEAFDMAIKALEQPEPCEDADKLKRCRFEYINACKIVAHPTPDTSKSDIYDAYAVIKALHPIFGDVEF